MNPDWNLEPEDECEYCGELQSACTCEDPYEPDTLEEFYGEE